MTRNSQSPASLGERLFAALQFVLPQHLLSRLVHWLTRRKVGPVHQGAIRLFIKLFKVDMSVAIDPEPRAYESFNAFFTRGLRENARPLASAAHPVISPVDGRISQLGPVRDGLLYQAKGHEFSLARLLGSSAVATEFSAGSFATIYLAPHNYHRIHMPASGRLRSMQFLPGRLFSVNAATARTVPGLFARNERVVCIFDGQRGPFAMVLVGALFVGSIETVWAGEITPGGGRQEKNWDYQGREAQSIELARGEEMGRFNMGSTVILVASEKLNWLAELSPGSPLKMGQAMVVPNQSPRDSQ